MIGELLALMGNMGIVSDLISEASRLIFGGSAFSTFWITLLLATILYTILWKGE